MCGSTENFLPLAAADKTNTDEVENQGWFQFWPRRLPARGRELAI